MKKKSFLFAILIVIAQSASAQSVWSSAQGTVTFTKAGFADWTQSANQDRISDSVWITRANSQNIFNIRKENGQGADSPLGTLWAFGTTDSFATLQYKTFSMLSGGNSQSLVGKDMVLQLVAEKIYLDIKFMTLGNQTTGANFSYVRAVSGGGATSVLPQSVPTVFELSQNYPNPFNPSTSIGFTLQHTGLTTLKIYDIAGREVAALVNKILEAGVYHQVQFDAQNLTSGVYIARLTSNNKVQLKKMMLVK